MIKNCPNCQQPISVSELDADFIHKCFGASKAVTEYDEPCVTRTGWNRQGQTNKLWGTRAANEGEKSYNLTDRGLRAETHKTKTVQEYINLRGD